MDVGGWLRGLGLGQYETTFRENEIDGEVLPDLTDGDLGQLGVPLGHRKRLLKAIAALRGVGEASSASEPAPSSAASDSAERRQLTVMFCDLVGSTALSARLDPEDMSDLIRAFQGAVTAAVTRFDGHVAKWMGDGALVYFGYPRAHEDDAGRAARAALSLVKAVGALQRERGVALEVRAGVATGLVVVGELMGEGEARERGVVGETPNLAARLQALAEPGSIVVAEMTRRLLGGAFELTALAPRSLKGFDAPVSAWSVVREAENLSRFEASRSEMMTPFIGREREVALLLDRWQDASEGEGQVVLLSGEAGIGKSRILATLRERIGDERHIALRYQCSPHHINDAFYPVVGQIWHAAGLVSGEPTAALLDKLEAMIALSGLEAKGIAPYLASLLLIPAEGRYQDLEMSPGDVKEHTVESLVDLFAGLTQGAPVLALLEDAHWIDPTSLDVFSRLVERLQALRALLVVTFRPEFAAPWVGRAHVTSLSLNRFGRRQAAAMIDRVTRGKALPPEVLEQIVVKTDGVPLFVEELTKTVLESGLLREENGAYALGGALTPLAIPSTLQDSLMARLDRLAPVKEIAQIGAAIGREFSYSLLEAVSPIKGRTLQEALRQLVASELIYARGAASNLAYVFKHALVQDTAYASLLRSRRQRIHADIARALTERFSDQADSAPAVIAHHYTEAGLAEPAARYWLRAAELAMSRSAHSEVGHYTQAGLLQSQRLEEGAERQFVELALQLARSNALLQVHGFAAPETIAAFTEAKRMFDAGGGTELQLFSVLYGLCFANIIAARMDSALVSARQMAEVAVRQDDPLYRLVGFRVLGTVQYQRGDYRDALESLRRAEQYCDSVRHRSHSHRFGMDPSLAVLCYKALVLGNLGAAAEATRTREVALAELPHNGHAHTVAACRNIVIVGLEFVFHDFVSAERYSAELVAYCAEKKLEYFRLTNTLQNACARMACDPTQENIVLTRGAMEAYHRSGARQMDAIAFARLAEAMLIGGDVTGADVALRQGLGYVEQSGDRRHLAEFHRLDGQLALRWRESDVARAEVCFLRAIEVAQGQEARLSELRAANDLARLWRDSGSTNNPRALLEPILAAIEGGETLHDVCKARALLA